LTAVTSNGTAVIAKVGIETGVSVGDAILVFAGSTAADFGLYIVASVSVADQLTLDRALAGSDADLSIAILADGVVIENSTNPLVTRLLIPDGTSAFPSIAAASAPSTGFFIPNANDIGVSLSGLDKWVFDLATFGATSAQGARIKSGTVDFNVPSVCPSAGDLDTGIGSAGSDMMTLVSGGVEGIRVSEANGEVSSIFGGTVVKTETGVSSTGASADITKASLDTNVSVGNAVQIFAGTTTGDYGLYIVQSTAGNTLTLDRTLAGTNADLSIVVIKDGVVIENSTNPLVSRIIVPSGSQAFPGWAIGDGTKGIYEASDDVLKVVFDAGNFWEFSKLRMGSANANGAAIDQTLASAVIPSLLPNKSDDNTGVGNANIDMLSLIAGGVEVVRHSEGNGEASSIFSATVKETITDATSEVGTNLLKAGENFLTTVSVGDAVQVYGGATAADFGLYNVQAVVDDENLTLDRAMTAVNTDVDFDILADGITIENSINSGIANLLLNGGVIYQKEITTPTALESQVNFFSKTDNDPYFQDGSGVEKQISVADYAGLVVDKNAVETTINLVNSYEKATIFDTDMPELISNGAHGTDDITIGATADYEISFGRSGQSPDGANKVFEYEVFQIAATEAVITGITNADPAVITFQAGHGFSNGNRIKILGVSTMTEVNNRIFTLADQSGDTFELTDDGGVSPGNDIDATGFAGAGTGGTAQLATKVNTHDHRKFAIQNDIGSFGQPGMAALTKDNTIELWVKGVT
ncbi:hypothetical protein LCGC14_1981400, partial [marine sediment metagenome]